MLDFQKTAVTSSTPRGGEFSSLAFSQTDWFKMSKADTYNLSVAVGAERNSGANFLQILSSGHEINVEDESSVSVMLPRRGRLEVEFGAESFDVSGGKGVTLRPSRRLTRVVAPSDGDFEACLVKLPLVHPAVQEMIEDDALWDMRDPRIDVYRAGLPALSDLIWYVLGDLGSAEPVLAAGRQSDLASALLDEHVRRVFLWDSVRPAKSSRRAAVRTVRLADEIMRNMATEALTVEMIAKKAGVGTRQLQAAFKTVTGKTPWEHLSAIRLRNVRLQLLAGPTHKGVGSIAMDCGFTHLGRFAGLYRATYGESPSETLKKSRSNQSTAEFG